MKHIKKFNEEFYPSTYKKIGDDLQQKGHYKKGSEFIKHAKFLEDSADRKLWEKYKAKYSKYGEVKLALATTPGVETKVLNAYPVLSLEIGEFEDRFKWKEEVEDAGYGEFLITEGYVVSDEDSYNYIRENVSFLNKFGNTYNAKYIEGGYIPVRQIEFSIGDTNDGFIVQPPKITGLDTTPSDNMVDYLLGFGNKYNGHGFMIADYKNAGKLRNLIIQCLTDESFDYPSDIDGYGAQYGGTMYNVIQRLIITNWSGNFGINGSEDFADEFKKKYPSPFNIFREI